MNAEEMQKILNIISDWQELVEDAQHKYVHGKPLNQAQFRRCMKSAFEWFLLDQERRHQFERFEVELYGLIVAYSCMPIGTESRYTKRFMASVHAAGMLASSILHSETVTIEGYKIIDNGYLVNGNFKTVLYDFESGDLKHYMELLDCCYWD